LAGPEPPSPNAAHQDPMSSAWSARYRKRWVCRAGSLPAFFIRLGLCNGNSRSHSCVCTEGTRPGDLSGFTASMMSAELPW